MLVFLYRLNYNPKTDTFMDKPGIKTIVPDFGQTTSIEYIDSRSLIPLAKYYKPAVDFFVSKGYTRGKDLVGAPYDWRFAPGALITIRKEFIAKYY